MTQPRLRTAPAIPDLASLGIDRPEQLLEPGLGGLPHAELVEERASWRTFRAPLPGTPLEEGGALRGAPKGTGTGWLRIRQHASVGWFRALRERGPAPGGASRAEREWNLLCALRAGGCATVEPLAVLAGPEIGGTSVLITRDADPGPSLADWAAGDLRALPGVGEALGLLEGRLASLGVLLPELLPADVRIQGLGAATEGELAGGACALEQILSAKQGARVRFESKLEVRELPSLVLLHAAAGRLGSPRGPAFWREWCEREGLATGPTRR